MLRVLWASWLFHLRSLTMSGFFVLTSTIQPVIFATIAFYLFRSGHREESLLWAALGAGMMGIWSSTLFGSGGAIQWQRWLGTLELLVAAPPPAIAVLVPLTVATSTIGLYSLTATLLWGRVLFGIPIHFVHPWLFALAVPATVISLGLLGLLLASTFILYRNANALSNLLEYPVWLVTGLLVPLSYLPGWAHPIGWLIAPRWGVEAMRRAALGGAPLAPIGLTLALGAAYLALGALFLRLFERLARERATLSLT
jgi:ABC-2 type transport system permease protein